jgi:adenylate cyclase
LSKIMFFSAAVGVLIALLRHDGNDPVTGLLEGALSGVLIGLGCTATDLLLRSTKREGLARRLPIAVLVVFRSAAFSLSILIGLTLPFWLISSTKLWLDPTFGATFLISILIAALISIVIEIVRLLGTEATLSLVTGRYRKPRLEDRFVLFADLVGSTALAERIGDLRFHAFLGDVAYDLSGAIERARGDVHRYVGDAVIVTWKLDKTHKADAVIQCAQDMHDALAGAQERYTSKFGSTPSLRVAIHCGPLAAGEIGNWKKEIALLGDTMNTAARLEGAARDFSAKTVVSDAVVKYLSDPTKSYLSALPEYAADGKSHALALWRVSSD